MEAFGIIFTRSDLVVVGYNLENADMTNPRGEIIRERFYVFAETARGARLVYTQDFGTDGERAEKFVARVQAAVDAGRSLDCTYWVEDRPCYGSEAWEASGIEAEEAAMERRMAWA